MHSLLKYAAVFAVPALLFATTEAQSQSQQGNPAQGATLYDSCVPCHTLNGKGIAGKAQAELLKKMAYYQSVNSENAKIMGMHAVLKPMSEQDLLDLSAYISKM